MKSRTTITILSAVCVVECAVIGWLAWLQFAEPAETSPTSGLLADSLPTTTAVAPPKVEASAVGRETAPLALAERNLALETELTAVKKELDLRKSEISFSYGSVRDSGRFVGMTFRKMFETAAAREAKEAQERMADNQINVLSLGPFIQDAEVMESDPGVFAQFQAPLISEVLGIPAERGAELEALLADLKAKSLKLEAGSAEWIELNDSALRGVTALLSEEQRQAMKGQIGFFQQYGVLVIPAYSLLHAASPSVVAPAAPVR